MKVFYTASSMFFYNDKKLYQNGVKYIKDTGAKVFDHLISALEETHTKDISEELFTKSAKIQSTNIKNSDVLVAEITDSSGAVGFHIATALSEKKPVLVLRKKKDKTDRLPGPIIGNKSKLMRFSEYSNSEERTKAIKEFLSWSKKKLDSKFILIISAEIDRYLEWASQENRVHKAQIVRNAIEKVMKKDQEYTKFLGEE